MSTIAMEDSRMKRIAGAIRKQGAKHDALIEILHIVEDSFGYLPLEVMKYISMEMRVPASKIYGVATFYHFFSLKPKGEHNCVVCTGTACHVKGSLGILNQIEHVFGLKPGETTPDEKLGLQTARCLGCCGLAPVVVIDDEVFPRVKADDVSNLIRAKVGKMHESRKT